MKKIIFSGVLLLLVSCTTANVTKTSIYTKDQMIDKSIERVRKDYGIEIDRKDVGIMKTGYGVWKVILYGMMNPIFVMIDEKGVIQNVEVKDYIY